MGNGKSTLEGIMHELTARGGKLEEAHGSYKKEIHFGTCARGQGSGGIPWMKHW